MITPWEKLTEKLIYKGFRTLVKRTYRMPDGTLAEYDISMDGDVAVVLPITRENKIVLGKEFRPGPGEVIFELPAGFIEEGEEPQDTAMRELREETGYEGQLIFLGKSFISGYSTRTKYHFLAVNCEKKYEQVLDPKELIEVSEVSVQEFRQILATGMFVDIDTAYMGLYHLKLL